MITDCSIINCCVSLCLQTTGNKLQISWKRNYFGETKYSNTVWVHQNTDEGKRTSNTTVLTL